MHSNEQDTGVLLALLRRLENERMSRLLDIKKRIDRGEKLQDYDIRFLEDVFADAERIKPILDRHPEYHELAGRVVNLYHEITTKALENETKT